MIVAPKLHLYFHTPVPIFKARVNMAVATYPANSIDFDGVTLGAYTDVLPGMTLVLGTTDGGDDLGRVRVKLPEADNIRISRSSKGIEDGTVDIQDNAYITVWDDYRVWAKLPYFDLDNGVDFKDGNIEPDDNNVDIPPVANCGPGFADYIGEGDIITVTFPKSGVDVSYAMADGATITDYLWDVGDGTITVGTSASDVITATFPAGFRWVSLTVTDSNGKTHTARCPVLAVDPEDDVTYKTFKAGQRLEIRGQTLNLELGADLPRDTYPDGTLVMFWWNEASSPSSRAHMKFIGWVGNENYGMNRDRKGFHKKTSITCRDVTGMLDVLPGFPQALEREESESLWSYMPGLDMNKSLHYLLHWHSTALELADFILPEDGTDYNAMRLDASGATLFQQVDSQAQKMVPDHMLTCNSQGQMVVRRNWMYDDVGDRPTAAPIITEDYWNDLNVEYIRHPRVHVLRSGAIVASETYDDNDEIPLAFSIAPGVAEAFGQGTTEATENEGLTLSQADLNRCEGHRYALLNSRYGEFKLTDPTGEQFWEYEPALMNRVQLNIGADKAAQRGFDFTQMNALVKSVDVGYSVSVKGTVVTASTSMEKEASGYPARTFVPEDVEPVEYVPPPPPEFDFPGFGLDTGTNDVVGVGRMGDLCRTSNFQNASPTWDVVYLDHSEAVEPELLQCFVVDPFSPGYIDTPGGDINGWVVNKDGIWRITDLFGATPGAVLQHSFAPTDAMYDGTYAIAASFGEYFAEGENPWIIVTAVVNRSGAVPDADDGVWAIYSIDAGATWSSEVHVTAVSNAGVTQQAKQRPTIWTSPRTPGYGITFAHTTETIVEGYKTEDWGATWSKIGVVDDDAVEKQPLWHSWFGDTTLTDTHLGPVGTIELSNDGSGGAISHNAYLNLRPPAAAIRVETRTDWVWLRGRNGGTIDPADTLQRSVPTNVSATGATNFVQPTLIASGADEKIESSSFTTTYDKTGGTTWAGNREAAEATPPTSQTTGALRWRIAASQSKSGSNYGWTTATITVTVTEIELSTGEIYTPGTGTTLWSGEGYSGGVHVPWPDNADEAVIYYGRLIPGSTDAFSLHRADASGSTDITPSDATGAYGPYRGLFSIRTHDNDRTRLLFSGKTEGADGLYYYSVFVSDDAGDTWTQVQGPDLSTEFGNLEGWEAAFAQDDLDSFYIWGGSQRDAADGTTSYDMVIGYSTDFGATIQNKTGNLGTLESSDENLAGFIGIAGGPTV